MFAGKGHTVEETDRTDTDMPMSSVVFLLTVTLIAVLLFFGFGVVDSWTMALISLIVVTVISFLFTTVAARAIAIVGMNPVSGMTLMTLILSSIVLVKAGLSGPSGMVAALIIGGVVCTALVVALLPLAGGCPATAPTPKKQETYKFLGILVASVAVTGVILLLNKVYGFGPESKLAAPQANAMAAVIRTLMSDATAPWGLYVAGGFMALILEFLKISPLAFALGMYLPIELNTPILIGGLVSHFVINSSKDSGISKRRKERGTLIASGFIAGGALMGVVSALIAFMELDTVLHTGLGETAFGEILSVILFAGLCFYVYWDSKRAA